MFENNDKKPTKESELDITELLRRYMPEEYGDGAEAQPQSAGNVGEADKADNIKDYGTSEIESVKRAKPKRRLMASRGPADAPKTGVPVSIFTETDTETAEKEPISPIFDEPVDADSESFDGAADYIDEEIEDIYDNIEDFQPDGVARDEEGVESTSVYELGDFGREKNFDPDIDIFSEFEEPADELYDYIDENLTDDESVSEPEIKTAEMPAVKEDSEANADEEEFASLMEAAANDAEVSEGAEGEAQTEGEMNDFDVNIMLALGMDDELEQTIGIDKVSKFVEKQQGDLQKSENINRERAALDYEYTNKSQTREVAEAYQTAYRNSKIKLIFGAVLTFALMLFECHASFGIELGGAFSPTVYPVVYIMVSFQLLVLIAAPALRSLYTGLLNFFRGKPSPESIAAFALILTSVYDIVICFLKTGETGPETYNFPVAIGLLMLYVYEFINIRCEIFSFSVISSKKPKFALQSLTMAEARLEHEAFSDMMEEDDNAEDISVLKIESADFVNDYFLRTNHYPNGRKFIGFIVPAAVIVAAVFFAYKLGDGGVYGGMKAALSSALVCLPMSVFYMFSHPFYRANEKAYESESTIVGEGSVEEYADAAIISFDDKNVFPSTGVNVRGINVFGNNRIDTVLYYAASVFCTVGGPLSDVFDLATRDIGYSADVKLLKSLPGLLEADVDGSVISLGTIDALEAAGIRIPAPLEAHRGDTFEPTVSVMYMAKDGKFISRMLVSYIVDSDFEYILKQLDKSGMFIGIKTFDPNITEQFIAGQVKLSDYPVRIIRCKSIEDKTKVSETTNSGLVSKDSPKSVLETVTLCEKVLHARSVNTMILIISLFVSLIVSALAILFGAITLSPFFIAIYALLWMVPMFITSRVII